MLSNARRVFSGAVAGVSILLAVSTPLVAQTSTTINGVVASQPNAPAKLVSCSALASGTSFLPAIAFDQSASLKSSTVTFAFFDKANGSLGQIALSPPYKKTPLPTGADTFTCAIEREELADGSIFPAAAKGGGGTALVIGGVVGVAIIAALAGHGSGGSTPAQTQTPPTPTPPPTATPTATPTINPSASPTASPTATPTGSPTATPTIKPTATPTPTASPTPQGAISLTPSTLTFTTLNTTMNTTISESMGYTGTFSVMSTTCGSGSSAFVTYPAGPYSNPTTLAVTSQAVGNCMIVFADKTGNTVTLTINVTSTGVVVNKRGSAPRDATPAVRPLSEPRSAVAPHRT